jgi:X-X-X-Leu-X-X-Gly heptad repeat protein
VTQIAGSLAPTLASITDFVVQVTAGFRNLSPETQKFISVGAALAVGLSAIAVPLGLVVAGMAAIGVPIAAAVAGIAALTAGIIAFWPEIKNAAAAVSEFIAGAWASFVAAWDGVVEKVHVVTAAIKQFGVDLLAIFRALPEQMVQIGGEIIQGLWNGIVAKWEAVKAGLYDITSGIKSSFTDFFDIHSPSKVMHEVGRNVMQGFNDGMQSLKGGATEIADGVGKTVTSSFNSIGSSIADAIKGTKTWKDVALDALKAVASQILSTSSFGGGLGGGIIKGLLGGLIGFANGGSILPGGSGGIDSQVVAFRKSPTEQVDIYDPRKGSRGGGGYAPVYNIDARGADAGAIARIERGLQERDRTEAKRVAGYNHTRSTRGTRA